MREMCQMIITEKIDNDTNEGSKTCVYYNYN